MSLKSKGLLLLGGMLLGICFGCGKASPPSAARSERSVATTNRTIARIYWAGAKSLALQTNSTAVQVFHLPEAERLRAEVLDKLAMAPWRFRDGWTTNPPPANTPTNLVHALLAEVVQNECRLEVWRRPDQKGEFVLAVRLDDAPAQQWRSNLIQVVNHLTGVVATENETGANWSLKTKNAPNRIELSRAGKWTLFGVSQDKSTMVAFAARLNASVSDPDLPKGAWLDVFIETPAVVSALQLKYKIPSRFPAIHLTYAGDGNNVRVHGDFTFKEGLPLRLEEWNIPTNMINEPLVSFAAVRGIGAWASSFEIWQKLGFGPVPNQIFSWGQGSLPVQTFWAAPLPSEDFLQNVAEVATNEWNPVMLTNKLGSFAVLSAANALVWNGFPFVSPYLRSVKLENGDFLQSGLVPKVVSNSPPPAELLHQLARTNLVFYEWEITPPRVEAWIYLGQLFRLFGLKTQLPPDGAAIAWVKAADPMLGNCVTAVTQTKSNVLSVVRNSSIGFNSLELQLLADWLESPVFPKGLHSTITADSLSRHKMPSLPQSRP